MKDYIKMMLEAEQLKFLVFAHHLTMLQACTEAVIEAKVTPGVPTGSSKTRSRSSTQGVRRSVRKHDEIHVTLLISYIFTMSHNKNKCSTSHWPHHNTRPRLTHQLILHTSPHLYKFRPFCHSSCEHSTLLITGTHLSIYRWMDMYSMYYLKVSGCMDVSMSLRHGQCTQLTFSHCIHG